MKKILNLICNSLILVAPGLSFNTIQAQSTIHGQVNDSLGKPVSNANVLLLRIADSGLIKGILTNDRGEYVFNNINPGNYFITTTYTGYVKHSTPSFTTAGDKDILNLGAIALLEKGVQLSEVKVASKKPLLEQKIDRLIINVENSITAAGNTALEVLERSPGIIVDHQNNMLAMNGKDGVVIMLNGKISQMPASSILQMLAGMNAGSIEKIELISTPPANLDAQGNAGYINIVLKENNNFGTNGSYSATIGYSKFPLYPFSININHRKGKVNLFGDVSFSRVKGPILINGYRKITNNATVTETYNSSDRTDTTRSINARLGLDYQLNKNTVIGVLLSGNERKYTQSELKESTAFKNQIRDTVARFSNRELNRWKNYSLNFNLQHRFKKNEELVLNLDYIHYSNNQPVNYFASYYDGSENFLYDEATRSGKLTLFIFKVGSLDYSAGISKNVKIQTGIKETIGGFGNDISFEKYHQNNWAKDPNFSADYTLNENYSAAYISFNVTVSKSTDAKLGARYEYTNSNLGTALTKNIVDRHYGNLFPTLFLTHVINENNTISFSYGMRINRPKFTDLAPFTYFSDAKTVITGNPELQPSITNTVKGDYTFKKYLFSLSYSKEDDAITGFQPETDSLTNKVVITPKNLINKKTVFVSLSTPVTVNAWWSMQYNISGLWQQTNLFYKKERLQFSQINYRINAIESFKLPKQWSAELSGFYQSPLLLGITTSKAMGSLDLGIKKKLNGNHGSFLVSANNILNTQRRGFYVNLPAQNLVSDGNATFIWPSYKLTYTHNFGKEKLKVKRERLSGAEEEKGRVN